MVQARNIDWSTVSETPLHVGSNVITCYHTTLPGYITGSSQSVSTTITLPGAFRNVSTLTLNGQSKIRCLLRGIGAKASIDKNVTGGYMGVAGANASQMQEYPITSYDIEGDRIQFYFGNSATMYISGDSTLPVQNNTPVAVDMNRLTLVFSQ